MCGLAAIFPYHPSAPPVDPGELLRIREAMFNRGPDGEGLWIGEGGRVGLAHRRLAILDLSAAGAQPMAAADGSARIVFNGEIYNFRELRRDFEANGHRFRSHCDTEVLLCLYQAHGAEMVRYLRGMYAFALWDERRQGLLLARDPFGIKPLYYADDGTAIRAASQVKALLHGGAVDTAPEPAGHVGFHLWGHVPEPYTLYRGIRALPAGSTLWVDAAGARQPRRFFNLAAELAEAEQAPPVGAEAVRLRLRESLLDSVRHHLIADVPVGLFLSAGLDSTTLLALAQETGQEALRTVTLGFRQFQGSANDEAPLAEQVARHYGAAQQTRWIEREDFLSEYPRLLQAMDQPSIDGVNSYFVSKAAREAGLKVALSGLGGDELFGGYPSFRQIPPMVSLFAPWQAAPWLGRGFRYVSAPLLKRFTSPKYAGLLEYGGSYGGAYLLRRGLFMPWELPGLVGDEMASQGWDALKTLSRLEETVEGVYNSRLRIAALETAWYMRNQLLRDSDWASMAHSLELRLPLVDVALFRAVAPLLGGPCAPDKQALARSPQIPLPDSVLRRAKSGFMTPLREWTEGMEGRANHERGLRGWSRHLYLMTMAGSLV